MVEHKKQGDCRVNMKKSNLFAIMPINNGIKHTGKNDKAKSVTSVTFIERYEEIMTEREYPYGGKVMPPERASVGSRKSKY